MPPALRHRCCSIRVFVHWAARLPRNIRRSSRGRGAGLRRLCCVCERDGRDQRCSGSAITAFRPSTYNFRACVSITRPPLFTESSRTLLTPCSSPTCISPETSMTSSVSSSHGIRGNVMLRWISIFSPAPLSASASLDPPASAHLALCPQSAPAAPPPVCSHSTRPIPNTVPPAATRWSLCRPTLSARAHPRRSW